MSYFSHKPLTQTGISHIMLPLLFIIAVAVTGTFMLVSSRASTGPQLPHEKGSIQVGVYAHTAAGAPLNSAKDPRVGSVAITATNVGTNVGQCDKPGDLTDNDRGHKANFGQTNFTQCPVALKTDSNHAKRYKVAMTLPAGFTLDPAYIATVSAKVAGNQVIREISVHKNTQTKVNFLIIGTNGNVSSAASNPGSASATSSLGTLVLYSDSGRYSRAAIGISTRKGPIDAPVTNAEARCGSKKLADQPGQYMFVSLKRTAPTQIRCSASLYNVFFLKKGETLAEADKFSRVAPSITTGYCTHVHSSGISRTDRITTPRKCPSAQDSKENAVQKKLVPILTTKYTPNPIIIGKPYIQEFELKLPNGEPMSPEECAGDVIIKHVPLNDPGRAYPIRYNSKTKTCLYRQHISAAFSAKLSEKKDTLELHFRGNGYLNGALTQVSFERKRP